MLSKKEIIKEFKNRCMKRCIYIKGRVEDGEISKCPQVETCVKVDGFCELVFSYVFKEQAIWDALLSIQAVASKVQDFRNHIETAYLRNPTGCGGSFGEILCYEIHETGLTFKDLARLWNVDLVFLAEVIKDHVVKLKPIEGAI